MRPPQEERYGDFSRRLFTASGRGRVIRAQIELTYDCNLHCLHCYTDPFNRPDLIARETTTAEVLDLLGQLQAEGVLWVCLTGGEIFMRPDFFTIYDAACDRGFLVTLFSNGTLITGAAADRLAARPPFSIELSIHGATEETFDKVTQVPGSFGRFLEGLKRLLDRKLPVKVKTSGMTVNRHELDAIKSLVEGYGLAFRLDNNIYPRLDGDTSPALLRLSPEDRIAVEAHFAAQLDQGDCVLEEEAAPAEPVPDRLYRCGCGTNTVHVSPYGDVGACTFQREPRFSLRERPLHGHVQELFARIRALRYRGNTPCRACGIYQACEKIAGIAAAETGDAEKPVPHFCETAHLRAGLPPPSFSER